MTTTRSMVGDTPTMTSVSDVSSSLLHEPLSTELTLFLTFFLVLFDCVDPTIIRPTPMTSLFVRLARED